MPPGAGGPLIRDEFLHPRILWWQSSSNHDL